MPPEISELSNLQFGPRSRREINAQRPVRFKVFVPHNDQAAVLDVFSKLNIEFTEGAHVRRSGGASYNAESTAHKQSQLRVHLNHHHPLVSIDGV